MSYTDSVRYLYSLGNELKAGAKFGLERIEALLAGLGNPQSGQRFVHVAGTNGKGSTCAIIASILRRAGVRTGLYTSPHLIEPTERIQINGEDVSANQFAAAFHIVHSAAEELIREGRVDAHPSYFETVTAMALLIFRERTQISVIEVGLGGRLDATNIITPELCVITPVSYDHEAYLGNSLEAIAKEKAGILKPGIPVVLARQESVAEAVITGRADELLCPVIRTEHADVQVTEFNAIGSKFRLDGEQYECPLPGRHQIENATAAILACRALTVPLTAIQAGMREVRWPGRLERVSRDPDFVLDGAHNPAGAAALARYIEEFCANRPVWLVYGAMRDKALEEVTEHLFPLAQRLILTSPDFPRALRAEVILEMTNHPHATLTKTVAEAIAVAKEARRETIVFFTGSLYLVGEVRKLLVSSNVPVS
ncbi:MAG: bifunctional folylpolyglutamate synthase/dihydrofolate synthase [Acidobacteriaceae bacterium]|nr:bifunctional folylpolyglutamate synthase/dihydrofolate synthase [Acidobacteriaceae bacterium]